jgi:hypothetical protein
MCRGDRSRKERSLITDRKKMNGSRLNGLIAITLFILPALILSSCQTASLKIAGKEVTETKVVLGGGLFCPGEFEWDQTEEKDFPK